MAQQSRSVISVTFPMLHGVLHNTALHMLVGIGICSGDPSVAGVGQSNSLCGLIWLV